MIVNPDRIRPTRAEIDLAALRRNLEVVRQLTPAVDSLSVVKANAFCHGAVVISRALVLAVVRLFGVAMVEDWI